jgi:hypothetical protein
MTLRRRGTYFSWKTKRRSTRGGRRGGVGLFCAWSRIRERTLLQIDLPAMPLSPLVSLKMIEIAIINGS